MDVCNMLFTFTCIFRCGAKGYHLDFYKPAQRESTESTWNGSSATIIDDDDENAQVWGTIWEIDLTHMADLDR